MANINAAFGFSRNRDIETAVKEASIQIRSKVSFSKIELCLILFTASQEKVKNLAYEIKRVLNPNTVVGYHCSLLIVDRNIYEYGLTVIAFSGMKIVSGMAPVTAEAEDSERFIWRMLRGTKYRRKSFCLFFSALNYDSARSFSSGIERGLGRNFPFLNVFSCRELSNPFIVYNENIFSDVSAGIVLFDDVRIYLDVKSGFSPLGKGWEATSFKNNIVKEIGNKPAVDFYRHYFGEKAVSSNDYFTRISRRYPLGFKTKGALRYSIAMPLSVTDKGELVFLKNIPSDELKLMISTKEALINTLKESAENLKKNNPASKIALLFDSFFRYKFFGRGYSRQLVSAKEVLGNIPLVGGVSFYSLGVESLDKLELGHSIFEHSYSLLGVGGR